MAVKVIILRRVPAERAEELKPLLLKLRAMAMAQPGYVSGETLVNVDDPEEFLVISTWSSVEQWNAWLANSQRARLQGDVDALLERPTMYQVYLHG